MKHKLITFGIAASLILGCGAPTALAVDVPVQSDSVRAHDGRSGKIQPNVEVTTAEKAVSYKLINDSTGTLTEAEINSISNELRTVQDKMNGQMGVKFQLYTFIYDSQSKPVVAASKEVIDSSSLDEYATPLIFVYNKADHKYHFVVDSRISKYISANYICNLADELLGNGLTAASLKEFLIRTDSTVAMTIDGGFSQVSRMPINEKAMKEHVTVHDFTESETSDENAKNLLEKKPETKQKDSEDDALSTYAPIIAFVLALGTLIVIFKKRRKKNQNMR